MSAGESSV